MTACEQSLITKTINNSQQCWRDDFLEEIDELMVVDKDSMLSARLRLYIIDEEYDSDAIGYDLKDWKDSNITTIINKFQQSSHKSTAITSFYGIYHGKCPTLSECVSFKRINKILYQYKHFINQLQQNQENCDIFEQVYHKIEADYDIVSLENDNHHLMFCHSKQFEDIYKMFITSWPNNQQNRLLQHRFEHAMLDEEEVDEQQQIIKDNNENENAYVMELNMEETHNYNKENVKEIRTVQPSLQLPINNNYVYSTDQVHN
eukprot:265024_1